MPFLHVRSLPLEAEVGAAVSAVSRAFAEQAGVAEEHVTVTWDVLAPRAYAHAGATAARQPADSHPVIVDLLAPDFNDAARVEEMVRAAAAAVAREAGVGAGNVFVNAREARSGRVFDGGEIVRW